MRSTANRPASTLERSRMSSISLSRCAPLRLIASIARSRWGGIRAPTLRTSHGGTWTSDLPRAGGNLIPVRHCVLVPPDEPQATVLRDHNGDRIVCMSKEGAVVWDAWTGQQDMKLEGEPEFVCSAAFSPDDKRIIASTAPRISTVYPIGGRFNYDLRSHGSGGATIRVWDATTGGELLIFQGPRHGACPVDFSPVNIRYILPKCRNLNRRHEDRGITLN